MPRLQNPEATDMRLPDDDAMTLWDGTRGPAPPQPEFAGSLADRRALCVADLLMVNAMIQAQVRSCNPAGIDQLLGMIGKPKIQNTVFNLSDAKRRKLARDLPENEGVEIEPKLLTQEGWETLIDALVHRGLLLEWLARYCNLVQVRGG
jgi:hypothetical protein